MAYIRYDTAWESEFDNIASKTDKLQDMKFNQLKLEEHFTYKKREKISTNFEPVDNEDVIHKAYLDETLSKIEGQIFYFDKNYNEFKLQYNKKSQEQFLIQRAVKTTIQILFDKGLFDNFANADKVFENFLFTASRRRDLEKVNDVVG